MAKIRKMIGKKKKSGSGKKHYRKKHSKKSSIGMLKY